MSIQEIIDGVIAREGDYSDHPADRGGPTRFGITEAVARENRYKGDMRALPRSMAVRIYTQRYIKDPGFDKVLTESARIGEEMIDTGINMGVSWPGPWLQRVLNALNQPMHSFTPLELDGVMGPLTIAALRKVIEKRGADGELVILRALNGLQTVRYLEITENRPANRVFFYGWIKNRVSV
jgi:lysozyme family protein